MWVEDTGCFDWPGIIVYYDAYAAVKKGAATKLDSTAQCWYTEYASGQIGVFDDPQTIAKKVQWGKSYGLGGAFAWAIYADSQTYGLSKAMAGQAHKMRSVFSSGSWRHFGSSDDDTNDVIIVWQCGDVGQCGPDNGGLKCPGTQCCSQYGWCGVSTDYCGANCQTGYGTCANSSSKSASAFSSKTTKNSTSTKKPTKKTSKSKKTKKTATKKRHVKKTSKKSKSKTT